MHQSAAAKLVRHHVASNGPQPSRWCPFAKVIFLTPAPGASEDVCRDVFGFFDGTWSVAVNGEPWDSKFIGVWKPVVSPDGKHTAVEVRTDRYEYTIAVDGGWLAR